MPGVKLLGTQAGVRPNWAYFPIRIRETEFGANRNELHRLLREGNVVSRKYFYPLASRYQCYSRLPSASPERLPVAEQVSKEILCLPIYGELDIESVDRACDIIDWVRSAR